MSLASLGRLLFSPSIGLSGGQGCGALGGDWSILRAMQRGSWMVSVNLMGAFLPVSAHPGSLCFLWFVACWVVCRFHAFWFGLPTAPQVFPGSWFLSQLCSMTSAFGTSDPQIPGLLVESGLLQDGGLVGEGHSSCLLRLVSSFPPQSATYLWIQVEPLFEGFSVLGRVSNLFSQ